MKTLKCIETRRSIRKYKDKRISCKIIDKILKAAVCAPSGKNGQPWRFKVISDKNVINNIAALSIYESWMRTAPCFILVFLDKSRSYDYVKDVQSCGAAIQNIILCAHSLNIGSCWIGEILPKAGSVKSLAKISNDSLELMGIVALGYSNGKPSRRMRKDISAFLV
ncbi:MAG TPA: nitroreductase family protein [Firmicutes bacterium]|nr:nitroreductase family protein [Bacillota bacterium]